MRTRMEFCTRSTAASAVRPSDTASLQALQPAAVVGEHAVGLEHIAVLAGARQALLAQHLVDGDAQLLDRLVEPLAFVLGVLGQQLGDDDARLVQDGVAQRDAVGDRLAADRRRQRAVHLDGGAGTSHRAGDEMLGDHHGGGLQDLDVLLGVFLVRAVLDDEHAEDLAGAQDRHGQKRVIDFLARLRPVGEGGMMLGVGLVHGGSELGAAADQTLAALQARVVHGGLLQALRSQTAPASHPAA